jgi:hypothetical protein
MALPPLERIPAHLESQPVAPTRQNHRAAAPMFELFPCQRFRDTPSVGFFDITVSASNARDLVVHAGPAVSPPNAVDSGAWQFYLHPHQEDNLLAVQGGRTFYLVNFGWSEPFHIVRLESGGHILRIPPGTFHRSISDPNGSVVLNQAVRATSADVMREFQMYDSSRIPRLQEIISSMAANSEDSCWTHTVWT